jgi:hypothetical protein
MSARRKNVAKCRLHTSALFLSYTKVLFTHVSTTLASYKRAVYIRRHYFCMVVKCRRRVYLALLPHLKVLFTHVAAHIFPRKSAISRVLAEHGL